MNLKENGSSNSKIDFDKLNVFEALQVRVARPLHFASAVVHTGTQTPRQAADAAAAAQRPKKKKKQKRKVRGKRQAERWCLATIRVCTRVLC